MSGATSARPVVLVGLMGVGKSVVGRRLADHLSRPFVDTDEVVAEAAGCSIPEIFERDGEAVFRSAEGEVLRGALQRTGIPPVIATGGGVVLAASNRAALAESAEVVWLDASPTVLAERIGTGRGRPLLAGVDAGERLRVLDAQRRPLYHEVADVVVDADAPVEEVVRRVIEALAERASSDAPEPARQGVAPRGGAA